MAHYYGKCNRELGDMFYKYILGQLWQAEVLLLVNTIFAGVIVAIGAYGHRYRHYGFTRYLLLGATTLFLPVISYVLSAAGSTGGSFDVAMHYDPDSASDPRETLTALCWANPFHAYLAIVSTCLVLICSINTSPIVVTSNREDRSILPPFQLVFQGIWIVYLAISTLGLLPYQDHLAFVSKHTSIESGYLRFTPFALVHAKMALKCYAFLKARKSFALRRNPGLIVGYMQQLREGSGQNDESAMSGEDDVNVLPPLVVMGEDELQVEKQPHGYIFRKNLLEARQDGGLVTIDRVWQPDNMFLMPMPQQLKDICLSFALFKLLRCRFARYKLTDVISMETTHFIRSILLKDGQHERAFMMIADELSFLHDYYDSPLPISYSDNWLIITSMVISLLSIGYYVLAGMDIIAMVYKHSLFKPSQLSPADNRSDAQFTLRCVYECSEHSDRTDLEFGSIYSDLIPLLLLLLFVEVAEARDVASYLCSSWTKVILTCRCVRRASLKLSPVVPKWVGWLLRCRCNWLMRHWNNKMRQSSLLVLHPRQSHQFVLPGCLLRLLDQKSNNVKIPSEVKACIINALRSSTASNGAGVSKGITSLRQSQAGERLVWACNNNKGTSDTILVWHIATTILEVRHPHHQGDGRPSSVSDMKIAATHLSRYCAYLVESCPELLPDDDAWSKHVYKKVKKDAKRALATGGGTAVSSMTPEAAYRKLVELLGATQNHEVLKDAAKLAEQLRELAEGEETAWELLAGFWSEMILYVAPSDNIKGHLQAIDRGGELITLLWALLTHIGIIDRPGDTAASAPATGV